MFRFICTILYKWIITNIYNSKNSSIFYFKLCDLILIRQKSELFATIFTKKEEFNKKSKSLKGNNKTYGNNFNNDYNNFIIDEMVEAGIIKYQKSNKYNSNNENNFNFI